MNRFLLAFLLRLAVMTLGALFVLPAVGYDLGSTGGAIAFGIVIGLVLFPMTIINFTVSTIFGSLAGIVATVLTNSKAVFFLVLGTIIVLGNVVPLFFLLGIISFLFGLHAGFLGSLLAALVIFGLELLVAVLQGGKAALKARFSPPSTTTTPTN